ARLTMPTSAPSRNTGTRLIRCRSIRRTTSVSGVVLCDADDVAGHDLADPAGIGSHIFVRQPARHQQGEPTRGLPRRTELATAQQIAFGQDADEPSRMRKKAEDVAGYWGTIGRACGMLGDIDAWWGPEHGGAVQLRELRGAGGQGPPAAGDPRDH